MPKEDDVLDAIADSYQSGSDQISICGGRPTQGRAVDSVEIAG